MMSGCFVHNCFVLRKCANIYTQKNFAFKGKCKCHIAAEDQIIVQRVNIIWFMFSLLMTRVARVLGLGRVGAPAGIGANAKARRAPGTWVVDLAKERTNS